MTSTSTPSSTALYVQISRLSDDIKMLHSAVNNLANTRVEQVITGKTVAEPFGFPDLIELENPVDSAFLPNKCLNLQLKTTQS